ncbi:glycosyltransferase [Podospora aff. communis PSN243]|uniref:Glycosyltransferase n=1 Tax=Podospora aff. communis PSN243 TaxID=3040156 RepID=A0AAV9G849_9PEZI|nr:glycosyltransferase [Podospora aff. communis PSN243]
MTLAAAVSEIDITWIDGVAGKDVPDKVMPADSVDKGIASGNKGSWRAHMNALQRVVERNMTSALILEDDADWDVRLKYQLQVFAQAARAFTQPQGSRTDRARAEFWRPGVEGSEMNTEVFLSELSSDLRPRVTPYGDNWDVLWLGHCGTEFPRKEARAEAKPKEGSGHVVDDLHRPSLLKVVIPNDPTVPAPEHLKAHPFALKDALAEEYHPHTRVVHASSATTCTQAYAVSQQGARKLLWQFGLQTLTNGWDFMLKDWCDGAYDGPEDNASGFRKRGPICVTVQPPLFSHHYGKGAASDITAPGGGFINKDKEMTPYIRLSVRLNMGKLVAGERVEDLVDQFAD